SLDVQRDHNSYPTRRSSDLRGQLARPGADAIGRLQKTLGVHGRRQPRGSYLKTKNEASPGSQFPDDARDRFAWRQAFLGAAGFRSEEHTSELQSRENLVCRL